MVIREACSLVEQMQQELSPGEALAMLSIAMQLTILGSMPSHTEAFAAIDHIVGELRAAVMCSVNHSEAGHG